MITLRRCFMGLWLCLFIGSISFAQNIPLKTYTWQNFEFTYPVHWSIVLDQDSGEAHHVKLVADQDERYSVFLSVIKNFPEPDEAYLKNPVMASISFGLGPALKLAGDYGESAIALSVGSFASTDGPILTARFLISAPDPENKEFYVLECFHVFSEEKKMAYFVMLSSQGMRGQVNDNPTYYQHAAEAYTIARSILF